MGSKPGDEKVREVGRLLRSGRFGRPVHRVSSGMAGRKGTFEEPFEAGPRSLMVAVLTLALKDMMQDPNQTTTWPAKRIDAAKWFLGIGEEDGPGLSLEMIAREFDLDPEAIRGAVGAKERMDWEIQEMQRKRLSRSRRSRLGADIEEAMSHGE